MDRPPSTSVHPSDPAVGERERRLDLAIGSYFEAVRSGRPPDRSHFLAIHPDLADDLRSFFSDEDRLEALAVRFLPDDDREGPGSRHCAGAHFGGYELIEEDRQRRDGGRLQGQAEEPGSHRGPEDDPARGAWPRYRSDPRFRLEAEAVARLDHPTSCQSTRWVRARESRSFCLKLIEGRDLEGHISRLVGDPRAIAGLMSKVARAIHYAHLRRGPAPRPETFQHPDR